MRLVSLSVLSIALALPLSAGARTASQSPLSEHSALIARLQKIYADTHEGYPILIFDRNEFEWELAQQGLMGDTQSDKRLEFIGSYFQQKTNVDLDFEDTVNLESYTNLLVDSAFALRLYTKNGWDRPKTKLCVVFPAPENSNQRLETERILGIASMPEAYDSIRYENIKPRLSYEELRLFSLLHEIGHCLDRKFVPQPSFAGESSYDLHLSEAFAETFAALAMVREGYPNVAMKRAQLRTLYSGIIGPYLAVNPHLGMGSPTFADGGVIYHLFPVLRAAHVQILRSPGQLASADLTSVIEAAERIVSENALHYRTFAAISYFMKLGEKAALINYEDLASTSPDLFGEALRGLKHFLALKEAVLKHAIDRNAQPSRPQGSLAPIDMSALCRSFKSQNAADFFEQVNRYRSELRSQVGTPEEQRTRARELNGLLKKAAQTCVL